MEERGRLQSMGSLRVGHDWETSLSLSRIGEGNGNPLQCSCLENPRDGGAWWAAIYGVAQSRTRLTRLSSSSSSSKQITRTMESLKHMLGASWQIPFPIFASLLLTIEHLSSVQSLSRIWLCDPMNHSISGLPVHHQLPEFTQTHVHWIGDAIQPSHPLSSPSPPAPSPSQHQGLFQWINTSHEVAKVLEFQLGS